MSAPELLDGFTPNRGFLPEECKGKRVRVQLRRDGEPKYASEYSPMLNPGWPADGRFGLRWSLRNDPFDVVGYRML